MKRSLLIAFCSLLAGFAFISESFAQDPARIAFTNSTRSAILAKTVGGKLDTIFTSGWGGPNNSNVTKVRNLSVLASSADGKSLLIAGYFLFPNPSVGLPDSAAIFARIDSPYKNVFGYNTLANPNTVGGAKILLKIEHPEASYTKMLPLGCLTPDGKEWYGIFDKSQGGNGKLWFFHGNFSGLGTVDSIELPLSGGGYHMTNMITSPDSKTMLVVVADQIQEKPGRIRLVAWTPGSGQFVLSQFDAKITSLQSATSKVNPDWAFGFYFHILPAETPGVISAELALDVNNTGNLELFKMRVDNFTVNSLTSSGRQLPRTKIPLLHGTDQLNFFAGNTGNPGSDFDDKEVVVPDSIYALGNGGDMMASSGGDSVVFITCANDHIATNISSGIYIYDIPANTVYPVMNDETRMERQPIFMGRVPKVIPYKVGKGSVDNTSLDFGSINQGTMKTSQVVLTETVGSLIKVTSAKIVGPDQGVFNVTSTPAVPTTVQGHGSLTFNVSFTPPAAKTYNDTLVIHYQDSLQEGKKDSIISVPLTGIGLFVGGVATSTPSSFDLSVVPNPFTSSTKITVTAHEAGSTSVEIRDLLGKDIYSSKALTLGEGEKFTYTLDANELHLAPGTYFVIVRSGAEEATRQMIYIK